MISFYPHHSYIRLMIYPIYRWRKWDSKKLIDLLRVIQAVCRKVCLTPSPCSSPPPPHKGDSPHLWSSHTGKEDKIASSMVSAMTRDTLDAVGAERETESLPQAVEVTEAFLKMTAKQSSRMSGNEADLEVREGCSPQMVRHIPGGRVALSAPWD